jgi:retinol dehydrogenase-12
MWAGWQRRDLRDREGGGHRPGSPGGPSPAGRPRPGTRRGNRLRDRLGEHGATKGGDRRLRGLVLGERGVTPDGFEHVFAVNHLAPFLLTNLLLPKLTASEPARVVTVTSDAHSAATLDLDDPNLEHGWDSWRSYANSKLANIQFTRELARRLHGTGLTANCVHPGVVRTGFGREGRPLLRLGVTLARPFLLSPERGADAIVYLSSSPDVAAESGGYYVKRQRREPSAAARDDAEARKLWEISEKMTGLAPARSGPADAPA